MLKKTGKVIWIFFLLVITACQAIEAEPTQQIQLDATMLMQTSISQATEASAQTETIQAIENTAISAAKTANVTPTSIPTIVRTRPSNATPTRMPDCDSASAGSPFDVTIRDHTEIIPGQAFTKTWRLVNSGSCKWTRLYKLVFFSGNSLGASYEQNLLGEVPPGSSVDLSVSMNAPLTPGTYQSNWMLQNEKGEVFGIGPNSDAPFWVIIDVSQQSTLTPTPTQTPTLTPTPVIEVYRQGTLNLATDQKLDLDEGQVVSEDGEFDLSYAFMNNSHVFLPGTQSGIASYGLTAPTYFTCQGLSMGSNGIVFVTISGTDYMCYRTDEGRFGSLQVLAFDSATGVLSVNFKTWSSQ